LPAGFAEWRFETTSFHNTRRAILQGFALVTAISASGAQRNTMLTNILQRAPRKTLGQNPLDREVYNILLAAARNKRCKTRFQNPPPFQQRPSLATTNWELFHWSDTQN
jgi:hypothetical protein